MTVTVSHLFCCCCSVPSFKPMSSFIRNELKQLFLEKDMALYCLSADPIHSGNFLEEEGKGEGECPRLLNENCPLPSWKAADTEKGSEVKVAQSYLFATPTDYTFHGILQARIPEWVAFPFSSGSSQPRDRTQVSRTAGGFLTS